MSYLRRTLDSIHPHVTGEGKYKQFYALYEAVDTIFYSPADVNRGRNHVRDGIDLKRVMIYVWIAAMPTMIMGCYNVGLQANTVMANMGITEVAGGRGDILTMFGIGIDPNSIMDNFWHGFWYWFPIYAVVFVVGGFWEVLFASVRGHEINEGFFVTSILFSLIVPASLPLWQAALGISFGIVIGKEVKVSEVAIAQGHLTIRVTETPQVSQPAPFGQGDTTVVPRTEVAVDVEDDIGKKFAILESGVNLQDLVDGLNALGINPRDMIAILQALKVSGALHADIEVM